MGLHLPGLGAALLPQGRLTSSTFEPSAAFGDVSAAPSTLPAVYIDDLSGRSATTAVCLPGGTSTGWRLALRRRPNFCCPPGGRTDEALELALPDEEGRTSPHMCRDFAVPARWRAFAPAGPGRAEEAIAVGEAHPDPWNAPASSRLISSSQPATLTAACGELRTLDSVKAREALFEVMVLQEEAAEAIAAHPTVAEYLRRSKEPVPPLPRGRVCPRNRRSRVRVRCRAALPGTAEDSSRRPVTFRR